MNRYVRTITLVLFMTFYLGMFFSYGVHAEEVDTEYIYKRNKENLKSEEWLKRAGACERIGFLGKSEYAPEIAPLMKDTHPLVRLSAIRGLGMCGDEQYIESIVDTILSLGRTPGDRLFATNAGWALGKIDPKAGADLLLQKAEEKKSANFAVAAALGFIGGDSASAGIEQFLILGDKDLELLEIAVRSAGKLTGPLPVKELGKVLKDKKAGVDVKMAIVSAFRKRKDKESIPHLLKVISGSLNREEDQIIANAAAWALAEIGLEESELIKLLNAAIKGNDALKLVVCKYLLMSPDGTGCEHLTKLIKSKSHHVRMAICNVLMRHPTEKMKKDLFKMLNSDRSRFVRWSAAMALGMMKDDMATEQLISMAKSATNKQDAARLFEALTLTGSTSFISDLVDLIKSTNPSEEEIILLAGMTIATVDPKGGVVEILGLLNDGDASIRLKGVKCLRYFPTSIVVKTLIGNLDKEFSKMKPDDLKAYRNEVVHSLERITGHKFKPDSKLWMSWWEFYVKVQKNKEKEAQRELERKKERRKDHDEAVKFFGGSGKSEAAVEIGLYWLARFQNSDGRWDPMHYGKLGELSGDVIPTDPYDVGMTGLSLLSLSTGGYTHTTGKYIDVFERGMEWLLSMQLSSGIWRTQQRGIAGDGEVYEQAVASTALLEIYSMTEDEALKHPCRIAVDAIAAYQNILLGWRYFDMSEDNDSSVTGWYILALKTARSAGFRVFEKCFEGALRWYDKTCQIMTEYEAPDLRETVYFDKFAQKFYHKCGAGYQDNNPLAAMTAINLISRRFLGYKRTHPVVRGLANYLKDWKVSYNQPTGALNLNFAFYFIYYASLANFQMGGEYWREWNAKLLDKVISVQETDISSDFYGSWGAGKSKKGVEVGSATGCIRGGRIYATCLMVLTLEIYYRYHPMLEENEIIIQD